SRVDTSIDRAGETLPCHARGQQWPKLLERDRQARLKRIRLLQGGFRREARPLQRTTPDLKPPADDSSLQAQFATCALAEVHLGGVQIGAHLWRRRITAYRAHHRGFSA